jgi:hypothetical protein
MTNRKEEFLQALFDVMAGDRKIDPRERAKIVRWTMQASVRDKDSDEASPDPLTAPMERDELKSLTPAQLVDRFAALAVERYEADFPPDTEVLYWQVDAVVHELETREGEVWRLLLPLYTHPDIRIRFTAADWTKRFSPELARSRLLAIDDEEWSPERDPAGGKLCRMPVAALVERFAALAARQDEARFNDRIAEGNCLFWQLEGVEEELKAREGDQRSTLLSLYGHPNPQVRLRAVHATLAVAPEAGRDALLALADSEVYPQARDARSALASLDEGRYKPT